MAIIILKEKTVPKVEMFQIAPEIQSSTDTDSDGLNDGDEIDAGTDPFDKDMLGLKYPKIEEKDT